MSITRRNAHDISSVAARHGATVLGGILTEENGRMTINKTDVTALLAGLAGQNVVLVVGEVGEDPAPRVRVCLTCGREYHGSECKHCANVRSRLRG